MHVFDPTPVLAAEAGILSPDHLIETFGQLGLIVIIFLESAFAPLPGDSLLFSAGLLASQHKFGLNVWTISIGTTLAAIAGNQAGYWFGRKVGVALYNRPDSRWFKREHIDKTHAYFERFGPKTILLARLIPVVRGLAPIIAGVGRMKYRVFVTYNVIGGILWCFGFIFGGWFLGKSIPNVDRYVLPLVVLVIIVTSLPVVFEYYRAKKHLATPSGTAKEILEEELAEGR